MIIQKKQSKFASEFEEAIYGSESENSASEDEAEQQPLGAKSSRKSQTKQFIIEDEDEPLDLLDRNALAHISSTKPQQRRSQQQQAGQERQKTPAKTNKAGKLVINENDDDNDNDDDMDLTINDSTIANGEARDGISAYIQALKGKDAFTRGARDKIKFSNKRRKDENEFDDDMDGEDDDGDVGMGGVGGGRDRKNSTGGRGGRGGNFGGRGGRGRDRQGSFGGRGGRGGGGGNAGGRVQKPPQSPKQRGGGTASIGRKKF